MGQDNPDRTNEPLPPYMSRELLEMMLFNDRRKGARDLSRVTYPNGGTVVIVSVENRDEAQRQLYQHLVDSYARDGTAATTVRTGDLQAATSHEQLLRAVMGLTQTAILHITRDSDRMLQVVRCTFASHNTFTLTLAEPIRALYKMQ